MGLMRQIAMMVSILVPGILTVPQILGSAGCIWTGANCPDLLDKRWNIMASERVFKAPPSLHWEQNSLDSHSLCMSILFKNNYRANWIRLCKTLRMKIVETRLGCEICMSAICQTVKHYTKFLVMFVSYKSFHFLSYLWRWARAGFDSQRSLEGKILF